MNRTRTLLVALLALTVLAVPAWASAGPPAPPACAGFTPSSVVVGLHPAKVRFHGCGPAWSVLQEGGLFYADTRAPRDTFGSWLSNSDTGLSSVSLNQTSTGIFQLRRATRFHDGRLQGADWDTETWRPIAGATVRLFVGSEAAERAVTDKQGRFERSDRIEHVEYLGSATFGPARG